MIYSKFGIGQQIRHRLLGYLGVIIDVDPEYSLEKPKSNDILYEEKLRFYPWYHVVMESEDGKQVHAYLAESQIRYESFIIHPDHPLLDELSKIISLQILSNKIKN
ncbi:MAG: heat shock protein HspQ [Candidatus Makana argininalis]